MARITMKNAEKVSFTQIFELYISAVTARGVKDKTLATYKQHFHAISKNLVQFFGGICGEQFLLLGNSFLSRKGFLQTLQRIEYAENLGALRWRHGCS